MSRPLLEEIRLARAVLRQPPSSFAKLFSRPRSGAETDTDAYYQNLHDTNAAYGKNNWLLAQLPLLLSVQPRSITEIGCGNGQATRELADLGVDVLAVDWARSPQLADLPQNVAFRQGDVRQMTLPDCDVVASADVLEHFPPDDLAPLVAKLDRAGRRNVHVIACYDDGHSHLSIARPAHWLALFRSISPRYRLVSVEHRRNDPRQAVCVLTNIRPADKSSPPDGNGQPHEAGGHRAASK